MHGGNDDTPRKTRTDVILSCINIISIIALTCLVTAEMIIFVLLHDKRSLKAILATLLSMIMSASMLKLF